MQSTLEKLLTKLNKKGNFLSLSVCISFSTSLSLYISIFESSPNWTISSKVLLKNCSPSSIQKVILSFFIFISMYIFLFSVSFSLYLTLQRIFHTFISIYILLCLSFYVSFSLFLNWAISSKALWKNCSLSSIKKVTFSLFIFISISFSTSLSLYISIYF